MEASGGHMKEYIKLGVDGEKLIQDTLVMFEGEPDTAMNRALLHDHVRYSINLLRNEGVPPWIIKFIEEQFLERRRQMLVREGYEPDYSLFGNMQERTF
ncbi:MAG: hypothetical protein Q8910_04300 [Bacteroidota bacterium]|nr:hypothetical protein [Bacteroidota bacterium]